MRRVYSLFVGIWLCILLAATMQAATYQLEDGSTLTGEIVSSTEAGVIVRQGDGSYSDRVAWANFTQADLRRFAEDPKVAPYVAVLIEPTPEERRRRTDIQLRPVPRFERPAPQSLPGALFSSGVGIFLVLVLYAANIYAAREVAVFRGHPVGLVCGVSAVAPLIGPIVFLAMGTRTRPSEEAVITEPVATAPDSNPLAVTSGEGTAAPAGEGAGLRLADTQKAGTADVSQSQIFQRGAFTFNRRFFETRFSGFFGMVRRDAEKDMVLVIKSSRGNFVGNRISRIAAADVHIEVLGGGEVTVPFSDIQEIQLKHKDT